ncbi:MAG: hypothetical protein R6T91_09045 [Bacteroidales bacterium]
MKNIQVVLMAGLMIFLFACSSGEKKQRIEKIDSLTLTLDSVQKQISSLDSARIERNFQEIQKTNSLFDSIPDDKIDRELLNEQRSVERAFRAYLAKIGEIKDDLQFSYNQLDSLTHDVEKDLVPEGKFDYYFNDEAEVDRRLKNYVSAIVQETDEALIKYDSIRMKVKEHLEENDVPLK